MNTAECRPLVVTNSNCRRFDEVERGVLAPLEGSDFSLHETKNVSADDNITLLAEVIADEEPGVVVSGGGDGLHHIVANALLRARKAQAGQAANQEASVLFLPYGTGNDIPRAIHGNVRSVRHNFLSILNHGKVQPVSTMEVRLNNSHFRDVVGYAGVGPTADVSHEFNRPGYRELKKSSSLPDELHDLGKIIRHTLASRKFWYQDHDAQDALVDAHELLFVNMSSMAKRLRFAVDSFGESMITTRLRSAFLLGETIMRVASEMPRGGIRGEVATERHLTILQSSGTDPIKMQCDGEPIPLENGTKIDITMRPQSLRVLRAA